MKKTPKSLSLLFATFLLVLLSGCTLPRIIIVKDPLTPEEHLNLGVAYEKSGEFDNAIKEYKLAAKKRPIAYLHLGNAHFQKDEWAVAEYYYKMAIEKEPRSADAYNNLAWLYYTQGENLDHAERLAIQAIDLNPSKGTIYRDTLDKIRQKRNERQ
ncbi:MAG: tetratricopeptide repeat protein [Deltaproteobacteria bacterium]